MISSSLAARASFLLFSLLFSLSPSIAPTTSFSSSASTYVCVCEIVILLHVDMYVNKYMCGRGSEGDRARKVTGRECLCMYGSK